MLHMLWGERAALEPPHTAAHETELGRGTFWTWYKLASLVTMTWILAVWDELCTWRDTRGLGMVMCSATARWIWNLEHGRLEDSKPGLAKCKVAPPMYTVPAMLSDEFDQAMNQNRSFLLRPVYLVLSGAMPT